MDPADLSEEDAGVLLHVDAVWDCKCMGMDEVPYSVLEKLKHRAAISHVQIALVPGLTGFSSGLQELVEEKNNTTTPIPLLFPMQPSQFYFVLFFSFC